MTEPLVSIFLPTYNQEEFIAESIESALNQSYDNIEIVIGDDHSQDSTWEIVQRYSQEYPQQIVAFRNDENLGITGNCNQVLKRCSGKYIAFHAGDDILLEEKVASQVAVLEQAASNVLCYHDVEVFNSETDETIRYWNSGEDGVNPVTGDSERVARQLIKRGTEFMAAQGVMVERAKIPDKGYDERVPVTSDWLLWVEVCASHDGEVEYIDEPLVRYRKHNGGVTSNHDINVADRYVVLAIVEERYPRYRTEVRQRRGYMYYREGVEAIQQGKYKEGQASLVQGAYYSPHSWKLLGWLLLALVRAYTGSYPNES